MKKILFLSAFIFSLNTTEANAAVTIKTNSATNRKKIGYVAKGLGETGILALNLGIIALIKSQIWSSFKRQIIDQKQQLDPVWKLGIALGSVYVGYSIYKSAKGAYKNFKKAYNVTNQVNKDKQIAHDWFNELEKSQIETDIAHTKYNKINARLL